MWGGHAGRLKNRPWKTDTGIEAGVGFPSPVVYQKGLPESKYALRSPKKKEKKSVWYNGVGGTTGGKKNKKQEHAAKGMSQDKNLHMAVLNNAADVYQASVFIKI